jgi:hypothetical protein
LKEPDLFDRVHELSHRVLVEDLPGLTGVGADLVDGNLSEAGSVDWHQIDTVHCGAVWRCRFT